MGQKGLHLPAPRLPPAAGRRRAPPSVRAKLGGWVRLVLCAGSLGNVTSTSSRSRRKWVTGRWGGLSPRQHRLLGKQLPLLLRSFVSVSRLHCLLGYRRTQMPPLSALEDELRLGVGGKRERRWSGGRGRPGGGAFLLTWPLGFSPSP